MSRGLGKIERMILLRCKELMDKPDDMFLDRYIRTAVRHKLLGFGIPDHFELGTNGELASICHNPLFQKSRDRVAKGWFRLAEENLKNSTVRAFRKLIDKGYLAYEGPELRGNWYSVTEKGLNAIDKCVAQNGAYTYVSRKRDNGYQKYWERHRADKDGPYDPHMDESKCVAGNHQHTYTAPSLDEVRARLKRDNRRREALSMVMTA